MTLRMTDFELNALLERQGKLPATKKRATRRSMLESDLESQLKRIGAPEFRTEYKFHSVREWRFDFAWPDLKIAVEVDGLVPGGKGGHQTFEGVTEDCRKHAEALIWGWIVYRCTQPMVKSGEAAETILRLLTRR